MYQKRQNCHIAIFIVLRQCFNRNLKEPDIIIDYKKAKDRTDIMNQMVYLQIKDQWMTKGFL